jgi:subtilisin family serine protease
VGEEGEPSVERRPLDEGDDVGDVIADLAEEPQVTAVEPERPVVLHDPDGAASPLTGALAEPVGEAFPAGAAGGGVTVAVVDTGVDADHPALEGRVLEGTVIGDPDASGSDYPRTHGTGVAALLVGQEVGAAPEARVLPVDVFGAEEEIGTGALAAGIVWAVDNGADLINVSAGSACASGHDGDEACENAHTGIGEAVAYAERSDVVVITSAGNDGDGADYCEQPSNRTWVPAASPLSVTVGGTGPDGSRWACSPRQGYVDVLAPATGLPVAVAGGGYELGDGTSFAAPQIAGLAARILSSGEIDPLSLRYLLTSSTDLEGRLDLDGVLAGMQLLVEQPEPLAPGARPAEVRTWSLTVRYPELGEEYRHTFYGLLATSEEGEGHSIGRSGRGLTTHREYLQSCGLGAAGSSLTYFRYGHEAQLVQRSEEDIEIAFRQDGNGPGGSWIEWIHRGTLCLDGPEQVAGIMDWLEEQAEALAALGELGPEELERGEVETRRGVAEVSLRFYAVD